jgi:bidirectional [NiFe] hydrogenase diaphorase subunit
MTITLTVDDRTIQAPEGSSVLSACLSAGIYHPPPVLAGSGHPGRCPGRVPPLLRRNRRFREPVTACTVSRGKRHDGSHRHRSGPRSSENGAETAAFRSSGGLQTLPGQQGLRSCRESPNFWVSVWDANLRTGAQGTGSGSRHPVLDYYPNRCVLCGICVRVCQRGTSSPS